MHEQLKEYYGRILNSSADLKTNACCCEFGSMPDKIKQTINEIEDEVVDRFYG